MCRILWARWIIQSTLVNCWARSRPLLSKARTNICQSAAYDKYIFRGVTTRATIKPRESGLEKKFGPDCILLSLLRSREALPFLRCFKPATAKSKTPVARERVPAFRKNCLAPPRISNFVNLLIKMDVLAASLWHASWAASERRKNRLDRVTFAPASSSSIFLPRSSSPPIPSRPGIFYFAARKKIEMARLRRRKRRDGRPPSTTEKAYATRERFVHTVSFNAIISNGSKREGDERWGRGERGRGRGRRRGFWTFA